MTVLAIDIGGTKMAAAIVDDDGNVLRRDRTPTNTTDPWPDFAAMLDRLVDGEQVDGVGIGCGGPMTWPAGEVSPLNIHAWRDFPLRARLAERYPGVPVRLHNDAVAFAAAEHWRGAAQGIDNMIGMVVSTGVGGGIVSGGHILDGATGNAGHIGHCVADPTGPICACGARGCLEAIARGPATVAWARQQGSPAEDGPALARLAAGGDPIALAAFARAGDAVGRVIAWCAALLDLQMVVVGGGFAQTGPPLWDPLLAAVREHAVLPFLAELRVVPPALGGDAGLVGAAALVLAGDRYWSGD
ncbi:MAG: glucokinase [Actinomycetota bacterium]|nr:glucokinase [Actinomycetota bacterium]